MSSLQRKWRLRTYLVLYKFIDCGFLISKWQGTASSWQGLALPGPPLAMPLLILMPSVIYISTVKKVTNLFSTTRLLWSIVILEQNKLRFISL